MKNFCHTAICASRLSVLQIADALRRSAGKEISMKKVLFVTGEYISQSAQNGLCVKLLIEELEKINTECHVLCIEECKNEKVVNENIYPIYYKRHINGKLNKLRQLNKFIHIPIESIRLVKKLEKKIIKMIIDNTYDLIIAVINPGENAEAVFSVKKRYPALNCLLYEIDPESNRYKCPSNFIENIWKIKSTMWEKKIYRKMDWIIHMESHRQHFENKAYSYYLDKTFFSDIPNLKFLRLLNKKSNERITAVYAGAFYPVLREPDYMIDLFSFMDEIDLNIYTGEIYREHINELSSKKENIHINNFIPQEALNEVISKADLLVSIGNKESDFLPSKVLYYIGSGKIILHLYSDDNDVAKKYFEKYPKAILINQNVDIGKNIEIIKRKFDEVINLNLDEEQLKKIFYKNVPEYTTQILVRILNGE